MKCTRVSRLVDFVKRVLTVCLAVIKDANSDGINQLLIVPVIESKFIGILPALIKTIDEYVIE